MIMNYATFKRDRIENLIEHFDHLERGGFWRRRSFKHILMSRHDLLKVLQFDTSCAVINGNSLILPDTRIFSAGDGLKLHVYAHHLNSSQMFCVNAFYPLMSGSVELADVMRDCGIALRGNVSRAIFEYTPDGPEHTNFDFFAETDFGEKIYFEIKYTEQGFGSASESSRKEWDRPIGFCYRRQVASSCYAQVLGDPDVFFKDYQVNRNIAYVQGPNDHVVFMFPKDNSSLKLPPYAFGPQVHVIDSNAFLKAAAKQSGLQDHYANLSAIYFG